MLNRRCSNLAIGLESASVYGFHVQRLLADYQQFRKYATSIIVFPPKLIARFRESMDVANRKNDKIDSTTAAYKIISGPMPKFNVVDSKYLALQRLTRHRFHLMQSLCREKCYCSSIMFLKFSDLCQSNVFSNNFSAAVIELLTEFMTPDDIASCPLEELVEFIKGHGKNHFSDLWLRLLP